MNDWQDAPNVSAGFTFLHTAAQRRNKKPLVSHLYIFATEWVGSGELVAERWGGADAGGEREEACGPPWSSGWGRVGVRQSVGRATGLQLLCARINLYVPILLFCQTHPAKSIRRAEARLSFFFLIVCSSRFVLVNSKAQAWVSAEPFAYWAFLSANPQSLPPLCLDFLFCLSLSLSLFAFYLLHFSFRASFTTLFSSRSCIPLRSYSSLLSLCGSPFPSPAGHTPSALVTGSTQLPETSVPNHSRQEAFVRDGNREREKNKGLM